MKRKDHKRQPVVSLCWSKNKWMSVFKLKSWWRALILLLISFLSLLAIVFVRELYKKTKKNIKVSDEKIIIYILLVLLLFNAPTIKTTRTWTKFQFPFRRPGEKTKPNSGFPFCKRCENFHLAFKLEIKPKFWSPSSSFEMLLPFEIACHPTSHQSSTDKPQ
jgi:hypothetical protein